MQLFTQLWPAVIEILSVVLCDYRSNEFSMAVIFSLLVFSLQVKTCRIKMTKTTQVHHVDAQISPNCLIVAVFNLEDKPDNSSPMKLFESCSFFLSYFNYRLSFPPNNLLKASSHTKGSQTAVSILF